MRGFGAVMALMSWRRPDVYVPAVELGHFIMVATMMPAVSRGTRRWAQIGLPPVRCWLLREREARS